ncbi:hypothetical protein ACQY0O_003670 [Thecaphora frezii]|nr:putative rhamnogalacturonan lyase [Thecaphora frezii]
MKSLDRLLPLLVLLFQLPLTLAAVLNETSTTITLSNARLTVGLSKSTGMINSLRLDGQDLLGPTSGNVGNGPYLDGVFAPKGFYQPGKHANFTTFTGDDQGAPYAGVKMSDTNPDTGLVLEFTHVLRGDETGLHNFARVAYKNSASPVLGVLQELRTLFRPSTKLWTHITSVNEKNAVTAPIPLPETVKAQKVVQDATWDMNPTGAASNDPYVKNFARYYTKYTFSDKWEYHRFHGLYSDGTTTSDGKSYGAWLIPTTRDTYFNGPKNSDLTSDANTVIAYNYLVSNHHGNNAPNITNGFDRTFGPFYYFFNSGKNVDAVKAEADAEEKAKNKYLGFYDILKAKGQVEGYVPSSSRGRWTGTIKLPKGAKNPVAVLSVSGHDFQDNAVDTSAYQYWASLNVDDNNTGTATIENVKAGKYRLTVYADGIFGQHIVDGITVTAGARSASKRRKARAQEAQTKTTWEAESHGTELWRIGTPDRSSGEFKHGTQLTPQGVEERRIYWGAYDFVSDFPKGVDFYVGKDEASEKLNYVHWSYFGGTASNRPTPVYDNVNNWTVRFDVANADIKGKKAATLTVQLAGAKTAAGNTDSYNASETYANLPLVVGVNGKKVGTWTIPWHASSSCAVRSAVSCYTLAHRYKFDTALLKEGQNQMVLSLPYQGSNYESAALPSVLYVQYDAIRLEVD